MLPCALARSPVAIAVALAVIAACTRAASIQEAGSIQEPQLNHIDEALSLELDAASDADGTNRALHAGSEADAAASGDAMVNWARVRMRELQQQREQEASAPASHSASNSHENLDFRSYSTPDSVSVASPEDIRNLFYSDASRAEVTPPSHSPTRYYCNTLRSLTCCEVSSPLYRAVLALALTCAQVTTLLPPPPAARCCR
jgi:hypothetical protein